MIGREGGSDRAAGGRLNSDVLEAAVAKDLAIGDAIERHAAGKAEVFRSGLPGKVARQPQHGFIQHRLNRGRDIHVKGRQQLIRAAHRRTEQSPTLSMVSTAALSNGDG
jgi:hypothetical protein